MTDTTNINSTIYNIIMGDRYLDGPLNLLPGKIIKLQKMLQTTALAIGIIIIFFLVGYILMQEFLIRIVLFHS